MSITAVPWWRDLKSVRLRSFELRTMTWIVPTLPTRRSFSGALARWSTSSCFSVCSSGRSRSRIPSHVYMTRGKSISWCLEPAEVSKTKSQKNFVWKWVPLTQWLNGTDMLLNSVETVQGQGQFSLSNSHCEKSKVWSSICIEQNRHLFCGRRPLPFGGSHLRLPSEPPGIRTTTGSLSALARPTPYQLSHRVACIEQNRHRWCKTDRIDSSSA